MAMDEDQSQILPLGVFGRPRHDLRFQLGSELASSRVIGILCELHFARQKPCCSVSTGDLGGVEDCTSLGIAADERCLEPGAVLSGKHQLDHCSALNRCSMALKYDSSESRFGFQC